MKLRTISFMKPRTLATRVKFGLSDHSSLHYQRHQRWMSVRGYVSVSDEVRDAVANNVPVVALESTIISHGMPYPRNLEVALDVERQVRANGAIPATVAVINGVPKVGLSHDEIELLASSKEKGVKVIKASRRDVAYACSQKLNAATTVASTMIFSHLGGVKVFATGGIGGVHRGAEITMDISADLHEFKKTPVTVVCAGIKSILDIPKTLEVLETLGVPVLGLGCEQFPAFFTNDSGIKTPLVVDSTESIARMMIASENLKLGNGMIVGVPNPNPAESETIQKAITEALHNAERDGIKGFAVTPYVLAAVEQLTKGKSLDANIALVMNNAKIASQIASHYCSLAKSNNDSNTKANTSFTSFPSSSAVKNTDSKTYKKKTMIFGGAVIDSIGFPLHDEQLIMGSSNRGIMKTTFGGVGRNVAEKFANETTRNKTAVKVSMVSAVHDDMGGRSLLEHSKSCNIDVSKFLVLDQSKAPAGERVPGTATYTAIHGNDGDLVVGIADMGIFKYLTDKYINDMASYIREVDLIIADGNLSPDAFKTLIHICNSYNVPVFFEPTSDHKCTLPVETSTINKIDILKPNFTELIVMLRKALELDMLRNKTSIVSVLDRIGEANASHVDLSDVRILGCGLLNLMHMQDKVRTSNPSAENHKHRCMRGKHVVISLGPRGVVWCGPKDMIGKGPEVVHVDDFIGSRHFVAAPVVGEIKHTSGAGDAFCAGLLHSILTDGHAKTPTEHNIQKGLEAAAAHLSRIAQQA